VLDSGSFVGLWWVSASEDRIAATWANGDGTAGDAVTVQMFDREGTAIAPMVSTHVNQPWNVARGMWIGDRYVLGASQRAYACGGTSSTTCKQYLFAVDKSGVLVQDATQIGTGGPFIVGGYTDGTNYAIAMPGTGVGSIALRSFSPSGAPAMQRELFATAPGESIGAESLDSFDDGDRVLWTYDSTTTGLTVRATNRAGVTTFGPASLGSQSVIHRGSANAVVVDGVIVRPSMVNNVVTVSRWSSEHDQLPSVTLPGTSLGPIAIARDADQIYLVTMGANAEDTAPADHVWRLGLDGRIAQLGIELPDLGGYTGAVATDHGVIVFAKSNGSIVMTRVDCP
jgi:hypothetical protein